MAGSSIERRLSTARTASFVGARTLCAVAGRLEKAVSAATAASGANRRVICDLMRVPPSPALYTS